jgi:hypothetical protein
VHPAIAAQRRAMLFCLFVWVFLFVPVLPKFILFPSSISPQTDKRQRYTSILIGFSFARPKASTRHAEQHFRRHPLQTIPAINGVL